MDDRNDLFGDDDFGFDDDLFGDDDINDAGGDFDFGDDDDFGDAGFDDLDFGDDDDFFVGDDEVAPGASRAFLALAALLIFLFALGLGAVILLSNRENVVDPFDATSTFVAQVNATTVAEIELQQTRDADAAATRAIELATFNAEQTQIAVTSIAQETLAAVTQNAIQTQNAIDATASAVAIIAQQTLAAEAEQTRIAAGETAIPTVVDFVTAVVTPGPVDIPDVQLTATALAELYLQLTPTGNETPTREAGIIIGTEVPGGVRPGELPQTGFIDENIGILMLMAFGLVGVIFASRRLRAINV